MKKILRVALAVAIAGISSLTANAQTRSTTPYVKFDYKTAQTRKPILIESSGNAVAPISNSKEEKKLSGNRKALENLRNAYSYYAENSPYVYDAGTNAFFRVQRGTDEDSKGNLFLITSTDKGNTWSTPNKYYDAGQEGQARYPSVQVLNKNKSNSLNDVSYVFYAPVIRPKNDPNGAFDGSVFGLKEGNGSADMFFYEKPEQPSSNRQKWGTTTSWISDQSVPISYMAQTLLSQGPGGVSYGQYGQYGFIAINADKIESQVPDKWGLSVFRGSTDETRSYNDKPTLGIDEEGTIYALFCNMFADDETNRIPAVSKSNDGGKTWQDFMRMPVSVLSDYFSSLGSTQAGIAAYGTQGFQVFGKDDFSYIFRISYQTAASSDNLTQIVEAYYQNGSWSIRKVADITGSVPSLISKGSDGADTAAASQLDNEIQYVRTSDGNLLVKYLDFSAHTLEGKDLQSSDIFVCAKSITGNSWSAPQNVTNDAYFDKLSWIPSSLPDLKDIPMIEIQTVSSLDENTTAYLQAQRRIDDPQLIVQFTFSVSTVGVDENQSNSTAISLHEAYPNPASAFVEIPFSLDQTAITHIDLFTALGDKVATLQSGMSTPGFHAAVFNTENLAPGTYYYTLTAGTAKITKMLSVVR